MLPIEFQPIPRARPLIADMIAAAKKSGSRIAGIVNADCMMIPFLDLSKALENLLDNGVVLVERLNISQHDLRPTGKCCFGFDAFFFTIESLEKIQWTDDWKIGEAGWDYFFPLAFRTAGQKVRTCPSPGLIHLDHEQNRNHDQWRSAMIRFFGVAEEHPSLRKWTKQYLNNESDESLHAFSRSVYNWLHNRETLYIPKHESVEELIAFMLTGLLRQSEPLSVKQLAREFPSASVRAARRILGRAQS